MQLIKCGTNTSVTGHLLKIRFDHATQEKNPSINIKAKKNDGFSRGLKIVNRKFIQLNEFRESYRHIAL